MPAYVFNGPAPAPYPWGMVNPGEVAVFMHRPPDSNWAEVVPPVVEQEPAAETPADEPAAEVAAADEVEAAAAGELRQPNKAASADDWKAYAVDHGGFEAVTGVHPDDATRKAIVDHYTAEEE